MFSVLQLLLDSNVLAHAERLASTEEYLAAAQGDCLHVFRPLSIEPCLFPCTSTYCLCCPGPDT
jgi:hypothetical protein